MNPNKIKKNPTTEIKEKLKKSKFDLLTNENDFLVKSLKKAGQSPGFQNYIFSRNLFNLKFVLVNTTINQFLKIDIKFMTPNKFKKNPTNEIKEKLKKSKFDLLTNENDFLVKSLKKAGQSLGLPK